MENHLWPSEIYRFFVIQINDRKLFFLLFCCCCCKSYEWREDEKKNHHQKKEEEEEEGRKNTFRKFFALQNLFSITNDWRINLFLVSLHRFYVIEICSQSIYIETLPTLKRWYQTNRRQLTISWETMPVIWNACTRTQRTFKTERHRNTEVSERKKRRRRFCQENIDKWKYWSKTAIYIDGGFFSRIKTVSNGVMHLMFIFI